MIDYDKLISDLDKVFNANSPGIQELDNLIKKYAKNQQMNIDYFINNNLEWNATASPEDVKIVLSELEELKKQVAQEDAGDMAGLSALCGIILNNLPYQTNTDVCKLKARIDNVKLGIETNKKLISEQKLIENKITGVIKKDISPTDELVQRIASYQGNGSYNTISRQRALLRVAYQNATAETPLNLIFKHVQTLSMDLDNIIDYAVKNHVNLNNLTTQYKDVLKAGQLNNLAQGKWKTEVAKDYMTTAANLKRIFFTECKARESQVALKEYQLQGYSKVKIITRHSKYVCKYCAQMDGTKVDIKDAKQGINIPPFHPNCFCHVEPVELDYDDALNKLDKEKPTTPILTPDEESALNQYISSDSYKINAKLRESNHLDRNDLEFIKNLDSALEKFPKYTSNKPLQRSYFFHDNKTQNEFLREIIKNDEFLEKGYLSTSKSDYGEGQEQVNMVIRNSHSGVNISSMNRTEQEVLFPRNTKFILDDIHAKDGIIIVEVSEDD